MFLLKLWGVKINFAESYQKRFYPVKSLQYNIILARPQSTGYYLIPDFPFLFLPSIYA